MITLNTIPAFVINSVTSPPEMSYLVATDSPVIFEFQRNDGTILLAENSTGYLKVTLGAGYVCSDNDVITIYDSVTDSMIEAQITSDLTGGVFVTDLVWVARYATDLNYILNYTQRNNYYLEALLTINSLQEPISIKVSANTKGEISLDISASLRAKVSGVKVGDYTSINTAEINQSGSFTLSYRERYTGDVNNYTAEGNIWYYLYAIRTKEQGSNLSEFMATDTQQGEWFNLFEVVKYNTGLPIDCQFFWPINYTALNVVKKYYSSANILLETTTETLNTSSKGYLNSIKIPPTTLNSLASKIVISIEEPSVTPPTPSTINYGKLYNGYAIRDARGLVPEGYHIPSTAEKNTLYAYLVSQTAGAKLKEIGLTHWNTPNTGAINSYGFNLKGAGIRGYNGIFAFLKDRAYLAIMDISAAYFMLFFATSAEGSNGLASFGTGLSVRGIKDDSNNLGSVTDIDGNVYPTIQIGTQVWMAENLITTKYKDGTTIPEETDNTDWSNLVTGAWCYYDNDSDNE